MPLPVQSAKHVFRSSRLKTLVGLGVLAALGLLLYAFHGHPALHLAREPERVESPPDAVQEPPEEEKKAVELQRSFEEPDFALLSGTQPHRIGCDVPFEGENAGPLIFLGIFSSAGARKRRDLYVYIPSTALAALAPAHTIPLTVDTAASCSPTFPPTCSRSSSFSGSRRPSRA
jgi:hypothetical protein